MSFMWTCDWCGDEIVRDKQQMVTVSANADKKGLKRERWCSGYVGHYHGKCWAEVHEAIDLIHEAAPGLAAIPVASAKDVLSSRPHFVDDLPLFMENGLWNGAMHCETLGGLIETGRLDVQNLRREGIVTLGQLCSAIDDESLRLIRGVGPRTFAEIRGSLERLLAAAREGVA
jgi:hypothetical protein